MKKSAVKISGIITTIIFLLLFALSILNLGEYFEIGFLTNLISSVDILKTIVSLVNVVFVLSLNLLISLITTAIETATVGKVVSAVLAVFCLIMFVWGIKEITISHKDDESFARCHKTCAFMVFTKFMFFLYVTVVIALTFVLDSFKTLAQNFSSVLGLENGFYYVTGALALVSFLLFILPASNFTKAKKAYANQGAEQSTFAAQNGFQNPQGGYVPQPTMQANMPPMPGYAPQTNVQQTNFAQPAQNPQPAAGVLQQPAEVVQNATQTNVVELVPGQNGVPQNISEKGLQDLQRLVRLKAMGSISDENYNAMWQKICQTNLN